VQPQKKIQIRGADEKIVAISRDRDIFGRLLIAAQVRQIDVKEILRYELSPVPLALAHTVCITDGTCSLFETR
jgi:hypothetical protein